jgi:Zn-dependent protease with chaperone function
MPDAAPTRTNSALWLGLSLFLLAILSNFLYFVHLPAAVLPWFNLVLPILALLFLLIGVVRAFRQPQLYRGKILGTSLTILAAMLAAASVAFFIGARHIPASAGAPQVGQRAPDFTLPDSTGRPVTLAQLFSPVPGASQPPKAVLLVFYRGYW